MCWRIFLPGEFVSNFSRKECRVLCIFLLRKIRPICGQKDQSVKAAEKRQLVMSGSIRPMNELQYVQKESVDGLVVKAHEAYSLKVSSAIRSRRSQTSGSLVFSFWCATAILHCCFITQTVRVLSRQQQVRGAIVTGFCYTQTGMSG